VSIQRIPVSKVVVYGFGILGWSISINIISVMLLYLYLPPSNSGMGNLVPQIVFLGFLNIIAIVTAGGRLFDAVVDPLISSWSDRSKNPKGRRIPFMRIAFIPLAVFAILIFFPPFHSVNNWNLVWLAAFQLAYYFFYGLYVIPYNAMLAELGHYPNGKLQLSTAQSVGFITGMVISSSAPAIAKFIKHIIPACSTLGSNQFAILGLNIFGAACMALPVFLIDETKYVKPATNTQSVFQSLKTALGNHNFRIFVLSDASYFMCIALISGGLLYYVKAILQLSESTGFLLMFLMVGETILFFPLVNFLAKKISRKIMIISSFFWMAFVFASIFWLGNYPLKPMAQAILLMVVFGAPSAFLNILPTTVIADIAELDAKKTKQNKEGMYFGMRALFQKFGQTFGIMVFALLTQFGKDPGHDLGLRLSGIAGAVLCVFAGLVYTRYREKDE
jgi:glycoside/pentoside/hexuronide:cation symporter, GPH family